MLIVEDLHKTFSLEKGEVCAVQSVSFEVKEGEFFALLGPSGSGKSTCLRCVAGLEQPAQGEISIGGKIVFSKEKNIFVPPEERGLGMVFQSYAIWPHMTVGQNVTFPLEQSGKRFPRRVRKQAVAEALEIVQLQGFENRPAPQLSGGQQQRVALARALVTKPKLLLLDEPLSNLDAKLRENMRHELRELTRSLGITTLYVTHDQVEALSMADKVGIIIDGMLMEMGPPMEIYKNPQTKVVAGFIGTTNMLEGVVTERNPPRGKVRTVIGVVECMIPPECGDGAKVSVMVRPEAVECCNQRQHLPNVFEGVVEEAQFLGTVITARIKIGKQKILAMLSYKDPVKVGDRVYVHFPCDFTVALKEVKVNGTDNLPRA
jgi:iron(III) transport system ATP-binding protein